MSKFLMIDIGAGTMDILYYDEESGLHYKAVAKSPVLYLAERAARTPGNLLITGCEMGGGAISTILRKRAHDADVTMSASAALTVHHDLDKVRAWGINIVDDSVAEDLKESGRYSAITICDLDVERLRDIMDGLGAPFVFDVVGICAQDHGTPPPGISHLDFRHRKFSTALSENPSPHALLYRSDEIPATFNRLGSIAQSARRLPAGDVYVMDSGMAAILGASLDVNAMDKERVLVLDVATSHTVGAAIERGELAGFFEYHTHDITLERLESLLEELADGKLEHERILKEGGHGAYIRKAFGFESAAVIIATGPKRRLVEKSRLSITFGAPLGDNMMTGTAGLLEAIRRRKGTGSLVCF